MIGGIAVCMSVCHLKSLFLGVLLVLFSRLDLFSERVFAHETVEIEAAVQVVGLVFEGLSEEVVGGAECGTPAVDVECAHSNLFGALDGAAVAGNAEASPPSSISRSPSARNTFGLMSTVASSSSGNWMTATRSDTPTWFAASPTP